MEGFFTLILLAWVIVGIVAGVKVFQKAGYGGWEIFIPIYNLVVFCKIARKPGWWVLLLLIPLVNVIFGILIGISFVKQFNKPGWHFLLFYFFGYIYMPYLAFSDDVKYKHKKKFNTA